MFIREGKLAGILNGRFLIRNVNQLRMVFSGLINSQKCKPESMRGILREEDSHANRFT